MKTLAQHLFPVGYRFAFARFRESAHASHFEARNVNPQIELPDNPFTDTGAFENAFQGRYGMRSDEINGDKVLERMGGDPSNPNPLLAEYCRLNDITLNWTTFWDARLLARPGKTADGESHITAWDAEISKTVIPGPGGGDDLRRENEELRAKLQEAEEAVKTAEDQELAVREDLAELKKAITAQVERIIIPEKGGGRPMIALREIAKLMK